MRTQTGILAIMATTASLAVHALLFSAFRVIEVPVAAAPPAPAAEQGIAVVYVPPEPESDAAETEKETKPEVTPPPPEPEFVIGEPDAKGYASHQVPGNREAVAPEAPADQAFLSLDPVGFSRAPELPQGSAGDAQTDSTPPPPMPAVILLPPIDSIVDALLRPPPPDDAPFVKDSTTDGKGTVPTEPAQQADDRREVAEAEPNAVPAEPPPPAAPPPPAVPTLRLEADPPVEPPQMVEKVEPAPDSRGRSAAAGAGADPAPESDSESDPFSMLGSAEYRDGRLTVRAGRKVKSRRPKIGLAGQVDLYQRREVSITLRVAIDATGKVTGVDVVRSSGSNEIDQPCRVAMYDWWFEPKKNAAGHAVPDRFDFTIGFR